VVRRIKRGVRPRAPVPSGAGGAPTTVRATGSNNVYSLYFTGSGVLLSANPTGKSCADGHSGSDFRAYTTIHTSGENEDFPSSYATYANTISTANAAQQCVNFANSKPYYGVALWFDESDDLWHCRATFNQNAPTDFTAADANARPVYGYNLGN
jgi:hypothetical protein